MAEGREVRKTATVLFADTVSSAALAEVLANRGDLEQGQKLVREARELLEGTDFASDGVLVLMSAVIVLRAAGQSEAARAAVAEARELSERKELVAALPRLDELGADL